MELHNYFLWKSKYIIVVLTSFAPTLIFALKENCGPTLFISRLGSLIHWGPGKSGIQNLDSSVGSRIKITSHTSQYTAQYNVEIQGLIFVSRRKPQNYISMVKHLLSSWIKTNKDANRIVDLQLIERRECLKKFRTRQTNLYLRPPRQVSCQPHRMFSMIPINKNKNNNN